MIATAAFGRFSSIAVNFNGKIFVMRNMAVHLRWHVTSRAVHCRYYCSNTDFRLQPHNTLNVFYLNKVSGFHLLVTILIFLITDLSPVAVGTYASSPNTPTVTSTVMADITRIIYNNVNVLRKFHKSTNRPSFICVCACVCVCVCLCVCHALLLPGMFVCVGRMRYDTHLSLHRI